MIEVGQVLWLKVRFNNNSEVATCEHPNLVLVVSKDENYVEVCLVDSLKEDNMWRMLTDEVIKLPIGNPEETVISRDSYAQLNNTIRIELFPELDKAKLCEDKLSKQKLKNVKKMYYEYRETHYIEDSRTVYMDKQEIILLNPKLK